MVQNNLFFGAPESVSRNFRGGTISRGDCFSDRAARNNLFWGLFPPSPSSRECRGQSCIRLPGRPQVPMSRPLVGFRRPRKGFARLASPRAREIGLARPGSLHAPNGLGRAPWAPRFPGAAASSGSCAASLSRFQESQKLRGGFRFVDRRSIRALAQGPLRAEELRPVVHWFPNSRRRSTAAPQPTFDSRAMRP